MIARVFLRLTLFCVFTVPNAASACAVCFGGEDDNRQAFIDTTVILTMVPLLLIGGFIWLMVRRIRRFESQRQVELAKDQQVSIAEVALPPSGS